MRFLQWSWKCDAPGCASEVESPQYRHYDGSSVMMILDPNQGASMISYEKDEALRWRTVAGLHFCPAHAVKFVVDDKELPA